VALVESGLDPDGEELGAEVAFADGGQIKVAAAEGVGEVKVFIHKALRGVGVGVDDEGGAMNACGAWGFWSHFEGRLRQGLGAQQGWDGEEQEGERERGAHRLGVSIEHFSLPASMRQILIWN
jgi:hypothetical protein